MRASSLLLVLAACNADLPSVGDPGFDAPAALPDDVVGPPLALSVSAMVPGQIAVLSATGAPSGTRVYFLFGPARGTTCPPALNGACLGITRPRVLGSAIAGAGGVATFSLTVPPALAVGTTGYFQAGTLPNPSSLLSDVVQRTITAPATPLDLLVADTASNRIYQLDDGGGVVASWASPVSNVRGVAWDTTGQDGFWVMGLDDLHTAYKLDLSGNVVRTLAVAEPRQDVRGLDYWSSATGDLLGVVSWNVNAIQVVYGFDVTNGSRYLESSHYSGGFLSGFWGLAITAQPNDFDRWTTWSNGDVELWPGSQGGPLVEVALGGSGVRGVDTNAAGELYVVDAGRRIIHHLAADGTAIDTIPLTVSDPADVSVIE